MNFPKVFVNNFSYGKLLKESGFLLRDGYILVF